MSDGSHRIIKVAEDDDGQRFDRWLKKHVPDVPYGLAQKLIRKGAFRIDGKRAKADTRLEMGQEVSVPAAAAQAKPTPKTAEKREKKPRLSEQDAKLIQSLVIYDDGDIIAINKPADLAVQGGSKIKRHIDGMLPALVDKKGVVPRLVHRLDKDTSGVLLLARSAKVAKSLGEMFKSRDMRKIYWALVYGVPNPQDGTIKAFLKKSGGKDNERMMTTDHNDRDGKYSQTEYAVLDFAHGQAAFVAFWPRTGRTHQIRKHAELLGTPIVGDHKYAGRNIEMDGDEKSLPTLEGVQTADTLHLHAHRLIFKHPVTGKSMDISSPLPAELKKSWKVLGFETKYKQDPFIDLET
jgi:23S rRNA pseudouridine955/2504/2580 synthase